MSGDIPSAVALIPARQGSKRVPGKNVRSLGGHPVIAYTIAPALDSGVFESVIVSTDSAEIAAIARHYGAEVPFLRPPQFAGDTSPDIEWLEYTLTELKRMGRQWDCFSLLRPTSPFRNAATIRRAWSRFVSQAGVDSIRAVEKCAQHPGKMWIVDGDRMSPLLSSGLVSAKLAGGDTGRVSPKLRSSDTGLVPPKLRSSDTGRVPPKLRSSDTGLVPPKLRSSEGGQPWHSTPYQALPPVYVQNASLEIAWTRVVFEGHTIAGDVLMPFLTEGCEGFDINDPHDWMVAERLIEDGEAALPPVPQVPYGAQWANSN